MRNFHDVELRNFQISYLKRYVYSLSWREVLALACFSLQAFHGQLCAVQQGAFPDRVKTPCLG